MCRVMAADKRDFLFRFIPQTVRKNLLLDDEAVYSTTDQVTARRMCDELVKFIPPHNTVVDATACVGGLTYTLTSVFRKVIAIEIDAIKYQYLKSNMDLLCVSDSVECVHGDALDVCKGLDVAAIIIDPPWGGPQYKKEQSIRLRLGNKDIAEVCLQFFNENPQVTIIGLKVPTNFDEGAFKEEILPHKVIHKAHLRKMHVIIIAKKVTE